KAGAVRALIPREEGANLGQIEAPPAGEDERPESNRSPDPAGASGVGGHAPIPAVCDLSADRVQNTSVRRDPYPSRSPALRSPSATQAATSGDIPFGISRITAATVGWG